MTPCTVIPPERLRFAETIPGGWNASHVVKRGTVLRLEDLEGTANVSVLMYNAVFPVERLNVPDSLKAQHTAFLTAGNTCMSDHGRVLMSIIADDVGWHDVFGGVTHRADVERMVGRKTFADARNDFHRNGYDSLLIELGKWGLGARDVVANINFFSKVRTDEEGTFHFVTGHSRAGAAVDLRAEMDTLVVMNSCPHPLDPASEYAPGAIRFSVYDGDPPGEDDLCRVSCEQNGRAFQNTERYHM